MNAIPPQPTPTLCKRRTAITIAAFYSKCDRPSNSATPIDMQHPQTLQKSDRQILGFGQEGNFMVE